MKYSLEGRLEDTNILIAFYFDLISNCNKYLRVMWREPQSLLACIAWSTQNSKGTNSIYELTTLPHMRMAGVNSGNTKVCLGYLQKIDTCYGWGKELCLDVETYGTPVTRNAIYVASQSQTDSIQD